MKKIYYQVVENVLPQVYLLYNSFNNKFILLNNVRYEKYKKENILKLEQSDPVLYKSLHLGFLSELLVPNTFCAGVFAFPFRSPMITIPARD